MKILSIKLVCQRKDGCGYMSINKSGSIFCPNCGNIITVERVVEPDGVQLAIERG